MSPDGAAILRKENGFLFGIRSVALSVSVKSLAVQGFFFFGNESNKEIEEKQR